jgi:hypothetical protein
MPQLSARPLGCTCGAQVLENMFSLKVMLWEFVGCYHRSAGKIEHSFAPHASEKLYLIKILHSFVF